jgi:hypothetical protein
LVVEFGGDEAAGDLECEGGVEGALVLAEAGEAVGVGGGEEAAQELAAPAEEVDGDVGTEEGGKGLGGDLDRFGDHEPVKVAQRDFAEEVFAGAGFGVITAAADFEAFGDEADAGVGVEDAGGGHGRVVGWVYQADRADRTNRLDRTDQVRWMSSPGTAREKRPFSGRQGPRRRALPPA